MGVLDALGNANDAVEDGTDAILDNEVFSVQDTVRGALTVATGHDSEEEFAAAASQDYENLKQPITDAAGSTTDNKALIGAGRGVETLFDVFVGTPAEIAYSSATGVDTRATNPEHAGTDYAPDALEAGELALIATGGTGKAAVKGGAKVAKAASGGNMLGGLARVTNRIKQIGRGSKTARKASSPEIPTQRGRGPAFSKADTGKTESLEEPDHLLPNNLRTAIDDAVPGGNGGGFSPKQKLGAGAVGGAAVLGAGGVIGGPNVYPDGYEVDHTYTGQPQADRVRQFSSDGNTQGYWVVVEENGGTVVSLDGSDGYTETSFPTSGRTPFGSAQQADNAYDAWQREQTNSASDSSTYEESADAAEPAWGDVERRLSLGDGWYLAKQTHNTADEVRFFVAGRTAGGTLVFAGDGGGASTTATPHPSQKDAVAAYEEWEVRADNGTANRTPDPGQDRPKPSDIAAAARGAGGAGGGLGSIGLAAFGALGAVAAAILFLVIL
jgi:hypothetical protein